MFTHDSARDPTASASVKKRAQMAKDGDVDERELKRSSIERAQSRLRASIGILAKSANLPLPNSESSITSFEITKLFGNPAVKPLDVYRAAACLREGEIREVVQLLVFSGHQAFPSALRLLHVMHGLEGNWELAVELIGQQETSYLAEAEQRTMTLIAVLGGKKAFRLCDWSMVLNRVLLKNDEESRIAMHMVLEKKWTGPMEPVNRIREWQHELPHSETSSIWREMRWAAFARQLALKVSVRDDMATEPCVPQEPAECGPVERLSDETGPAAEHYIRVSGFLLRRRTFGAQRSRSGEVKSQESVSKADVNGTESTVITPSVAETLKAMAGALSFGMPIVLEGAPGCGKTSLISFLARMTAYVLQDKLEVPGVTFIQMDREMSETNGDSFTSLVEELVPLPEGGGFRWRPGSIGLAVEKGHWLVFENIGTASGRNSVIPIISELASLRPGDMLNASGRGRPLKVGSGFRCIATRTATNGTKDESWQPPGGWGLWERIPMKALSTKEKVDVLTQRYPNIEDCVMRVVRATERVSEYVRKHPGPLSREPTLREAVRICRRLSQLRSEDSRLLTVENAVLETLDILSAWCPIGAQRTDLVYTISECWSLPADAASLLLSRHRPSFSELNIVRIGRASMPRQAKGNARRSMALTRTSHTLRMLERILRSLQMGEHVLLSGEAGSGKTSLVQELANVLCKKLVVINMSRQSELGDLVGGFRPLELSVAVPQLAKQFEEAFCTSVSKKKNSRFLDYLQRACRSFKHHSRAISLMRGAMDAIPREAKCLDENLAQKWAGISDELTRLGEILDPSYATCDSKQTECVRGETKELGEPAMKRRKHASDESRCGVTQKSRQVKKRPRTVSKRKVDFRFADGALVKAMREGHWVLLDEINLAPSELLERLVSVMDRGQVALPNENGDVVTSANGFRLFGAMNPPTDVGKRPLPAVLRTRFSELYAGDMMQREDIIMLTMHRLFGFQGSTEDFSRKCVDEQAIAEDVASFFILCCEAGAQGRLAEVGGKPVRFSLRSLSRMLDFSSGLRKLVGPNPSRVRRALYEGSILAFAVSLPAESRVYVTELSFTTLLRRQFGQFSSLEQLWDLTSIPSNMRTSVRPVHGYPVRTAKEVHQVPEKLAGTTSAFIISPTVKRTITDVSRALTCGSSCLPVLLQGPTAAGKTSLIRYLADITGNKLVRINNHEHTDLSEYIGAYVVTPDGSLVFQEGPLVRAARRGSWVLLDELNLAPPDVLESLNRLLDDNREIFLLETGEVVQAADGFRVFATQNPPGLYGGRKELSRAFRSRFVEIQVPDLSDEDLLQILESRCHIPKSFARGMISVMRELQIRRRTTGLFSGREGFVTARDLFRWANRGPRSKEELAVYGFYLLGERARRLAEKELVRSTIIKIIGIDAQVLDDDNLFCFTRGSEAANASQECLDYSLGKLGISRESLVKAMDLERIVPTFSMRRMITLMIHSVANSEPCLLVGATGGGKTCCCSVISRALQLQLLTVNCHRHTEASDMLGSFRPVRSRRSNRFFEWVDGPLVQAMRNGSIVLIDEINMADDAVVERLNSVLEMERTLLLSEKGSVAAGKGDLHDSSSEVVRAHSQFRILATMNPGGDFGKKELSPALRNRFTEVWIPPPSSVQEYMPVVHGHFSVTSGSQDNKMRPAVNVIYEVLKWALSGPLVNDLQPMQGLSALNPCYSFSIRDVSAWCDFVKGAVSSCGLDPVLAVVHGARLVFLDGISVGATNHSNTALETAIWRKLMSLVPVQLKDLAELATFDRISLKVEESDLGGNRHNLSFGGFVIPSNHGFKQCRIRNSSFSFGAPCTQRNCARLARAMAVGSRPVLLEGPPGCGKSSLIAALANAAGFPFVRINLSEATEMCDLVGTDSPGEHPGTFSFRDGPLLVALRKGHWVLLDELNLASQSVLEGLNSVLDHRRSIYIPELNQEFCAHLNFRLFGAQNPAVEGGGRRGLPRSFLNRFNRVHVEAPDDNDIFAIVSSLHPLVESETVLAIVQVLRETKAGLEQSGLGADASSFGLRDALRWCDLLSGLGSSGNWVARESTGSGPRSSQEIGLYFDVVVLQGLSDDKERRIAETSFQRVFGCHWQLHPSLPSFGVSDKGVVRLGGALLPKGGDIFSYERLEPASNVVTPDRLRQLQAMVFGSNAGWPIVVCSRSTDISESDCSEVVQTFATLSGKSLRRVHGGSLLDCDDFTGGYAQQDVLHMIQKVLQSLEKLLINCLCACAANVSTFATHFANQITSMMAQERDLRRLCQEATSADSIPDRTVSNILLNLNKLFLSMKRLKPLVSQVLCDIESLEGELEQLRKLRSQQQLGNAMSFAWEKSKFMQAIESGEWILVQCADRCPPAVLDRLNPILERPPVAVGDKPTHPSAHPEPVVLAEAPPKDDGSLVLLTPHPEFRIFFSFSSNMPGSSSLCLSRALLDRSLKICLPARVRLEKEDEDQPQDERRSPISVDKGVLSKGPSSKLCTGPNDRATSGKQLFAIRYWFARKAILLLYSSSSFLGYERWHDDMDSFCSSITHTPCLSWTYASNFTLDPRLELLERDLCVLHMAEAKAIDLYRMGREFEPKEIVNGSISSIFDETVDREQLREAVIAATAESFILSAQHQQDLVQRALVLKQRAKHSSCDVVRRVYVKLATLAEEISQKLIRQGHEQEPRELRHIPACLPLDPVFALDYGAAVVAPMRLLPPELARVGKLFRLEVLAMREFRSLWGQALAIPTMISHPQECCLVRAKRLFEIHQSGVPGFEADGCESLAYSVLLGVAGTFDTVHDILEASSGLDIPAQDALITLFRSARALLELMMSQKSWEKTKAMRLLLDIMELSGKVRELPDTKVLDLPVPMKLQRQVSVLDRYVSRISLVLMPRTQECQEVEARILEVISSGYNSSLSMSQTDRVVRTLASLSTDVAADNRTMLEGLGYAGARLNLPKCSEYSLESRLTHWKASTFADSVNRMQKAVVLHGRQSLTALPESHVDSFAETLFHAKCTQELRLSSVIALQQLYWVVDCLLNGDEEMDALCLRDLNLVLVSNLLAEKTAICMPYRTADRQIKSPTGIASSSIQLCQDSALSRFWSLPSARREAVSAMMMMALGTHSRTSGFEDARNLLTLALEWVLEDVDIIPNLLLEKLRNIEGNGFPGDLLAAAMVELGNALEGSDKHKLCKLQVDIIKKCTTFWGEQCSCSTENPERFLINFQDNLRSVGTSWICLGMMRVKAFHMRLQDCNGVDPSEFALTTAAVKLESAIRSSTSMASYAAMASNRLGGDCAPYSIPVCRLAEEFSASMALYQKAKKRHVYRSSSMASFSSFSTAVSNLNSVIVNKIIASGLLSRLDDHMVIENVRRRASEEADDIYQSCVAAAEALELGGSFSHFRDISSSLLLGLRELQYGLSCTMRSMQQDDLLSDHQRKNRVDLFWGITLFPRAAFDVNSTIAQTLERFVEAGLDSTSMMVCAQYLIGGYDGINSGNVSQVSNAMSFIASQWKTTRLLEEEEDERKRSLHVLKKAVVNEELAVQGALERLEIDEEQDFVNTFNPIQEEVEEALLGLNEKGGQGDRENISIAELVVQPRHVKVNGDAFWKIHAKVFPYRQESVSRDHELKTRASTIQSMGTRLAEMSEGIEPIVDLIPSPWDVLCSIDILRKFKFDVSEMQENFSSTENGDKSESFNFYKHASVKELMRASVAMQKLQDAISRIQDEHFADTGGHPVLAEVSAAIARVSSTCTLTSPLSNVIIGIENVLRKADEWRRHFASSQMRMNEEVLSLSTIVAQWRRMEMDSWKLLIRDRIQTRSDHACRWFFFLYDAIIHGALSGNRTDEEIIPDIISVVDQFLRSSPCGEFNNRLQMVLSLSTHVLAVTDVSTKSSLVVGHALRGIGQYYMLFSRVVSEQVRNGTNAIEMKLKEFSRLVSWDLSGNLGSSQKMSKEREKHLEYYRMKAASERTKRKLHGLCLEVDAFLQTPVYQYLSKEIGRTGFETLASEDQQTESIITIGVRDGGQNLFAARISEAVKSLRKRSLDASNVSVHQPGLSIHSEKGLLNMLEVFQKKIKRFGEGVKSATTSTCDIAANVSKTLRSIIRVRAAVLKDSKQVDIQPKKRAFVELLKNLRRLGLSQFQRQKGVNSLESYSWISSPDPSYCDQYNSIANLLFYQSAQQLKRLREVADTRLRSSDITTGEAQKSFAFCCDLFDRGTSQRSYLNDFFADITFVADAVDVLRRIQGHTKEHTNEHVRNICNHARLKQVGNILNKLQRVCLDLEVTSYSLGAALKEAGQAPAAVCSTDRAECIMQKQISTSKDSLSGLHVILCNAVNDILVHLASPSAVQCKTVCDAEIVIDKRWEVDFLKCREELRALSDRLNSLLSRAKTVSLDNVVVRVLTPTADFLSLAIPSLEHQEDPSSYPSGTSIEDLWTNLTTTAESLVELTLVGSQNVLKWNSLDPSGDDHKMTIVEDLTGDPSLWPAKLLQNAHGAVISLRNITKIAEIATLLKQNVKLLNCYFALDVDEETPNGTDVSQIVLLENAIGTVIATYLSTMVFPSAQKASLFHCHSLSLLRSLSSLFTGLCREGYCRPSEDQDNITEEGATEDQSGAGFGEAGEGDMNGARDVSEQIEDEEQLVGLQDEASGIPENGSNEDNTGIDLGADFDGELKDLSECDQEDGDKEVDEKQLANEKGQGHNIIDEKLWSEKDERHDNTGESADISDEAMNEGSDLAAKETAQACGSSKCEDINGTEENDKDREGENGDEVEGEDTNGEVANNPPSEKDSRGNIQDTLEPERDECPERENINPASVDDSDFETPDQKSNGKDDLAQPEHEAAESLSHEPMEDEARAETFDVNGDPTEGAEKTDSDGDSPMTGIEQCENDFQENPDKMETDEANGSPDEDALPGDLSLDGSGEVEPTEDAGAEPGSSARNQEDSQDPHGQDEEPFTEDGLQSDQVQTEKALPEPAGKLSTSVAQVDKGLDCGVKTTNQEVPAEGQPVLAFSAHGDGDGGPQTEEQLRNVGGPGNEGLRDGEEENADSGDAIKAGRHTGEEEKQGSSLSEPNPLRMAHKQDTINSWSKYLDIVQEEREGAFGENSHTEKGTGNNGSWELHGTGNEGDDGNDTFVLGAATEHQHRPLPNGEGDSEEDLPPERSQTEHEPERRLASDVNTDIHPQLTQDQGLHDSNPVPMDTSPDDNVERESNSLAERIAEEHGASRPSRNLIRARETTKADENTHFTKEKNDVRDEEKETGQISDIEAKSRWQNLVHLSSAGANILCEQLRLVLEPTIASGLAGGFRTGKRLNIRRLIEFVASDFRKDRIWLRRVRPDKRAYDVLLAIDDSESMCESGAGPMAVEALALIASALSRLEVGRLAVASFGKDAVMVRGFSEPLAFSDSAGANLLQQFQFSQSETNITNLLAFIQSEMNILIDSSTVEHIKLALVISDGRLSNRDDVKKRLRKLRESNVLVAFIIIDKPSENETSILDVRRVEYDQNGEIQVIPYMQEFPIDFYAIVQDVQQLPLILADALKQWIEITSTQL